MRSISDSNRVLLAAGVSLIGLLAAGPALAQGGGAPAPANPAVADADVNEGGIQDIVVTAQRTAQNLQNVPIAVSAFSAAALEEQQITNTSKLVQSIPNVSFTKGNFTGSNLSIRGIGTTAVAASGDSGTGIHVNDMPIVNPRLFEGEFYDLQRVEVLRGPQGTLYGRNATAGVVNFITNKADTKAIAAFGEAQFSNYHGYRVEGMVNVPITDKIAVRAAGYFLDRDGFTTNLWNDTQIDGRHSWGARGSVHWEATDALTADVMVGYFKENSDRSRIQKQLCITDPTGVLGCQPNGLANQHTNGNSTLGGVVVSEQFLRLNGFGAAAPGLSWNNLNNFASNSFFNSPVPSDPREIYTQFKPQYNANELNVIANIEYRFEKGTLSMIGGYTQSSVSSSVDYSLTVNDPLSTIGTNTATLIGAFGTAGKNKADLIFGPNHNVVCMTDPQVNGKTPNWTGIIGGHFNNQSCQTSRPMQYDISDDYNHEWSGEVHFESEFDGKFNFLLGGIYTNYISSPNDYYVMASSLDYGSLLLAGGANAGLGSPFFDSRVQEYKLKAWAIFGEVYYQINPELKLTLGGRYTSDDKSVQDVFPQPLYNGVRTFGGLTPLGTDTLTLNPAPYQQGGNYRYADASWTAGTGRVLLQWTPTLDWSDQTMVYASYSRGYKAGGINPSFIQGTIAGAKDIFGPEHVNAFEIGTKNRFLNGTLQANLTGFYYGYQGLQVSRILARSSFNDNIDATIYGIEAEFIAQPVDAVQFNFNISWLHTSIDDAQISDSRDPSAGRSDTVIIKDITNTANCVVTPTAGGTAQQMNAFVGTVNSLAFASAQLPAIKPVGGTNTTGAYSICNTLATLAKNPNALGAGLGAAIYAATGVTPGSSLPVQTITNPDGSVNLPDGVAKDLKGNHLQNSPEFKFAFGAQYNFDVGSNMSGYARFDWNFTGNAYGRIYNDFADRLPAYSQINAQVQLNGPNNRWYARAFIQNIANTNAVTGMYVTDASSGLFTNIFTLDPRTYGLAVGFRY